MKTKLTFILLLSLQFCFSQDLTKQLDSLLKSNPKRPFNGIVLVSQNGKALYSKTIGYSDLDKKTPLKENDQFVIGSISKQFTAVLVLQEFEKGRLALNVPIKKYLPELQMDWANLITVHDLLTHTHGIVSLDKPTEFSPGSQFSYSQIGYELLARIVAKTSGKSFAALSEELFKKCKMTNTFHPNSKHNANLVKGYTELVNGSLEFDSLSFENYAAAGSFVSTANDLLLWNSLLHGGKLLSPKTYSLMITQQDRAVRNHPIFGKTEYGYGITVFEANGLHRIGQTGFAPGFISMDFYLSEIKTSVIILENISYGPHSLKEKFYYQVEILKKVEEIL